MTKHDLQMLFSRTERHDACVLSVYLSVDQSQQANMNRAFETTLHDMILPIRTTIVDSKELERFGTAVQRVAGFISVFRPQSRSVAIFVDTTDGFMWHQQINSPLQSMARWDKAVFTEPLANLLDQHEQYCVALVDRAHLRIFSVFLGEIEECLRREFGSRRTRHIKTSGTDHIGSASQIQRKADEQVRANLRRSVMLIDSFLHLRKTDRLLLAGTPEITAQLCESLPKRVASRVIGTLNLAFESTPQEVLAASEPIATKDERDLENQCVDKVVTTAAKTEHAVVGLDSTLDAINFDRVWQLVYSVGARQTGFECTNCRALFAVVKDECPYCNGAVKAVADVVERMLERALRKGANVEVVTGRAKQNLDRVGGIGALLRTRTKPAAHEDRRSRAT